MMTPARHAAFTSGNNNFRTAKIKLPNSILNQKTSQDQNAQVKTSPIQYVVETCHQFNFWVCIPVKKKSVMSRWAFLGLSSTKHVVD